MFTLFKKTEAKDKRVAAILYEQVIARARNPVFYESWSVPDTIDGRFEMISLHAALIILRLEQISTEDAKELAQELFDAMFRDMDFSPREMGIGDLAVPKHMKRMLHGFNGRAKAYKSALILGEEALQEVIRRNIYGSLLNHGDKVGDESLDKMCDYVKKTWAHVHSLKMTHFNEDASNIFRVKEPGNEDKNYGRIG